MQQVVDPALKKEAPASKAFAIQIFYAPPKSIKNLNGNGAFEAGASQRTVGKKKTSQLPFSTAGENFAAGDQHDQRGSLIDDLQRATQKNNGLHMFVLSHHSIRLNTSKSKLVVD